MYKHTCTFWFAIVFQVLLPWGKAYFLDTNSCIILPSMSFLHILPSDPILCAKVMASILASPLCRTVTTYLSLWTTETCTSDSSVDISGMPSPPAYHSLPIEWLKHGHYFFWERIGWAFIFSIICPMAFIFHVAISVEEIVIFAASAKNIQTALAIHYVWTVR